MNETMDMRALLQRSLQTIERLEAKLATLEQRRTEPVAILGAGCRYPGGSNTPERFWDFVRRGGDAVTEVPKERWDIEAIYDPDPDAPGKTYARWGAFVDDVFRFDPGFFGISPREVKGLDPQQRLLLETSWEALEHAGIAPSSLAGSNTGIFVGMTAHDFAMRQASRHAEQIAGAYAASGASHSIASGRISYVLGAQGPNFALDTACSSSMVSIHSAIGALRRGESDLALAGGVTLTLTSVGSILTARARMMSFTGRCHTFDAAADGYVRGEGCAMVALKRLSDAERDGDRILAVIRGSAINQDGRSTGMTAPNGRAQTVVLRAALADAGLSSDQIDYIEAHGTGTSLGDPIEMNAIAEVYGDRPADDPLVVGSVKTNIGHTEGAAGVAGLIKAAYAVNEGVIPPHLNFETPNPLIPWDDLAVKIPVERMGWPGGPDRRRRAGVSSFGFSGTNAHMIIEEPPARDVPAAPTGDEGPTLLTLSAREPGALGDVARQLAGHLREHPEISPAMAAAELAVGRSHLNTRLAVLVEDRDDGLDKLDAAAGGADPRDGHRGEALGHKESEVVFMFTGQGAQYVGMGRELYEREPVFRDALDRCAAILDPLLPRPLLEVMFGVDPAAGALLDDTAVTQPALFALEWSLSELWRSWGVRPAAALGHSVGEYVAVCVSGALPLEDGLRLIAERGRLMASLPRNGTMAAVVAGEAQVRAALEGHPSCAVAAVNGPESTVVAGLSTEIEALVERLASDGVRAQRLSVSHAFHSPLMEPILGDIEGIVSGLTFGTPEIALASNVTGALADGATFRDPRYWSRHTREAVRFDAAIRTMLSEGFTTFLEIGPGTTLTGMAQQCEGAGNARWIPSLRMGQGDRRAMLSAAGALYAAGHDPDWSVVLHSGGARTRTPLPTYPFRREEYGFEQGDVVEAGLLPSRSFHPFLKGAVLGPVCILRGRIGLESSPWLADHRIYDFEPLPAAAFLDLAISSLRELDDADTYALRDMQILDGLILSGVGDVDIHVVIDAPEAGERSLRIYSADPDDDAGSERSWRLHARAQVVPAAPPLAGGAAGAAPGDARPVDPDAYYDWLGEIGAHYGPAFRAIDEISRTADEAWARLRLADGLDLRGFAAHPAILDACIQLLGVLLMDDDADNDAFMPVSVEECVVGDAAVADARCHVRRIQVEDPDARRCDIELRDESGALVLRIRGLVLRRVTRAALDAIVAARGGTEWLFGLDWEPAPLPEAEATCAGRWLILADRGGVGARLADRLGRAGADVVCLRAEDLAGETGDALSAAASDAIEACFGEAGDGPGGVVDLQPLDHAGAEVGPEIGEAHDAVLSTALGLAQQTTRRGLPLWVVTRGAQSVAGEPPDLGQAPVNAFAGVVASEYPGTPTRRVDLDPVPNEWEDDLLLRAVLAADGEDQMAFRGQARLAARLEPGTLRASDTTKPVFLDITERGVLENLALLPKDRVPPGPGEVELRVRATGVNFRDVLNALGMYPGDPGPLGSECAGEVTAVGEGVDHLSVGDEAVAMADASFATYVTAPANLVVRKPEDLSMAEAAGTPVAFMTADYALRALGDVRPGERVLIHAITGGLGMAAAQIARMLGAEVYGTAGTPAKREMALAAGAVHVGDSRSLDFAPDLMEATGGRGVDFVLNSLAGDFIPASLSVLAPGGRFVEVGKTDDWNAERVAREYPGIGYHLLYLGDIASSDADLARGMLETIYGWFGEGKLHPLPHRAWPLESAESAFRFMAQGLHTGKIVLTQPRPDGIRGDASYLVSGGLRGLGLRSAQWLAEAGARHLVLLGRSGVSGDAEQAVADLEAAGVEVMTAAADVSSPADLRRVLREARDRMPPLRGVIHAAGVLDDAMLPEQTPEGIAKVMAPKVGGALALHEATRAESLDFFAMYASGAGLMGAPGQANYAAANGFLDSFAAWRRAQGLHALSVDWGSWSEIGMASTVDERHRKRWSAMGLTMISPDRGVRAFESALFGSDRAQVAIMPMIRSRLPAASGPLFANLVSRTEEGATEETSIRDDLLAAPSDAREAVLEDWLLDQVTRVLALDGDIRSERHRSLLELGMDSLMAMELHNRIKSGLAVEIRASELLDGLSVVAVTDRLARALGPLWNEAADAPAEEQEVTEI